MSRQLWVRMAHPVADGPIEVPDDPGVIEDFESRGWVLDGTPPFEKKLREPLKLNSERGRRELAKFEAGAFPSVELQFALRESMEVTLEITCTGTDPHRPPHPDELLLTVCRDLREGGRNLYLKGRDGTGGWNIRDGDDGFRYHAEYPKVLASCPRCLSNERIAPDRLIRWLDAMVEHGGELPRKKRLPYRWLTEREDWYDLLAG